MTLSVLKTPSQTPFTRVGPDVVSSVICPMLDSRSIVLFFNTSKSAQQQLIAVRETIDRIMYSRIPVFREREWKHIFGVEVTNAFEPWNIDRRVLRAFMKTYYGPNPIGPGSVKDACFIPTVVPERVMVEGRVFDYNLYRIGELAEHPGIGHAAKYMYQTQALDQYGTQGAEGDHLVILLKGVVARNMPWSGQVQCLKQLKATYGCKKKPDALSQNTVLFAHHAVTGERPFGDNSGLEGRYTYGRTGELVQYEEEGYNMVSGGFCAGPVGPLGGSAPAELFVYNSTFDNESLGVGVLRKF